MPCMKHSRQILVTGLAACGLILGTVPDAAAELRGPNLGQPYDRSLHRVYHHPLVPGHEHRRFDDPYRCGYKYGGHTYKRVSIFGWTLWTINRPVVRVAGYGGPQMVSEVQAQLNFRGYAAGPVDGVAGHQTRTAIAAFQSRNGLQPSGVIDEPLLEALRLVSVSED